MGKLADHCGRALAEHAERQPRLRVLDGDLADSDGAIHFAQRHPDRFLMGGIAEQNLVSVAAGMAEVGLLPWVFSFAAFLCYRAYDQIRVSLSQAQQPVVLVGSHAGGLSGRNGKSHAAPNDLALMLSLPGVQVWAPGDAADTALAVRTLVHAPAPAYLRFPRTPLHDAQRLPGEPAPLRWLRPRRPVCLVSTGLASHWALATAQLLAEAGLEVGLLHCARLRPAAGLAEALAGVERIFVIEDHATFGGLGSLVAGLGLPVAVTALGWSPEYSGQSGKDEELLGAAGLTPPRLAQTIQSAALSAARS